ncbi:hypothetical protein PFISCL1PPCAC_12652, partial [Pristionchus fissidentatus]
RLDTYFMPHSLADESSAFTDAYAIDDETVEKAVEDGVRLCVRKDSFLSPQLQTMMVGAIAKLFELGISVDSFYSICALNVINGFNEEMLPSFAVDALRWGHVELARDLASVADEDDEEDEEEGIEMDERALPPLSTLQLDVLTQDASDTDITNPRHLLECSRTPQRVRLAHVAAVRGSADILQRIHDLGSMIGLRPLAEQDN